MSETVAALLTPPGKSALATVGIRGSRAWEIARGLFTPRSGRALLAEAEAGRYWLGALAGDIADEGILALRRAGAAPLVELHQHGGREVTRYLLDLLARAGVPIVAWDEFLRREEEAHRADAALALPRALTMRTAAILLDQYHGAFARDAERAREALRQDDRATASDILLSLERYARLGAHLTTPFRVVIAGAPNVGKSSLLNALAGYQRAIVSPVPGTTRDAVSTALAIDGWPVELTDTAGLRAAGEQLEAAGIEQARRVMAEADVVLWMLDASAEPVWPTATAGNLHVVVNKIDLQPAWDLALAGDAPRIAAMSGEGIDAMCAALSAWLVPDVPPPGAAVPISAGQVEEILALRGEARA
jgi:tRNA modification GTPase